MRVLAALIALIFLAGCTAPDEPDLTPADDGNSDSAAGTSPAGQPNSGDQSDTSGAGAPPPDASSDEPTYTSDGCGHDIDPAIVEPGYNTVMDDEQLVRASGRPIQESYKLHAVATYVENHNDREYAEIFTWMAPIRDALMCDLDETSESAWTSLVQVLELNDIKTHQDLSGAPNERVYSSAGIYAHLKENGPDHHPMMKYLEKAELELKCLAFTDFDFTNPEGDNHCQMHGLEEGSGYQRP